MSCEGKGRAPTLLLPHTTRHAHAHTYSPCCKRPYTAQRAHDATSRTWYPTAPQEREGRSTQKRRRGMKPKTGRGQHNTRGDATRGHRSLLGNTEQLGGKGCRSSKTGNQSARQKVRSTSRISHVLCATSILRHAERSQQQNRMRCSNSPPHAHIAPPARSPAPILLASLNCHTGCPNPRKSLSPSKAQNAATRISEPSAPVNPNAPHTASAPTAGVYFLEALATATATRPTTAAAASAMPAAQDTGTLQHPPPVAVAVAAPAPAPLPPASS